MRSVDDVDECDASAIDDEGGSCTLSTTTTTTRATNAPISMAMTRATHAKYRRRRRGVRRVRNIDDGGEDGDACIMQCAAPAAAQAPRSRFGHTAVVYSHSMYVFGGWDGHDTLQERRAAPRATGARLVGGGAGRSPRLDQIWARSGRAVRGPAVGGDVSKGPDGPHTFL